MPAETHVARGPVDPDDVFRVVRGHLAEILELVEAIEEEMGERTVGFSIDDDDLADLRTVRDYVDYVVDRLRSTTDD